MISSQQLLAPNNVITVKGVQYQVPPLLGINHSFFMPCLKCRDTYAAVAKYYTRSGYKLVWAEKIEQGVLGIRVWRVL